MARSNLRTLGVALLAGTALLLVAVEQARSQPGEHSGYQGTVIHVRNNTGQGMMFHMEVVTTTGEVRLFEKGIFLHPGEIGTFDTPREWNVAKRQDGDKAFYLIKVRGTTLDFDPGRYFWGGPAGEGPTTEAGKIKGIDGQERTSEGYLHIFLTLAM